MGNVSPVEGIILWIGVVCARVTCATPHIDRSFRFILLLKQQYILKGQFFCISIIDN